MEKKWNWQKARITFKPGENIYVDKLVKLFEELESRFGFKRTQKALQILFWLILGYLIIDLIQSLLAIF